MKIFTLCGCFGGKWRGEVDEERVVSNSACLHFSPRLSELLYCFLSQVDMMATVFFLTSLGSTRQGQLPKVFGKNSNRPQNRRRKVPGAEWLWDDKSSFCTQRYKKILKRQFRVFESVQLHSKLLHFHLVLLTQDVG